MVYIFYSLLSTSKKRQLREPELELDLLILNGAVGEPICLPKRSFGTDFDPGKRKRHKQSQAWHPIHLPNPPPQKKKTRQMKELSPLAFKMNCGNPNRY